MVNNLRSTVHRYATAEKLAPIGTESPQAPQPHSIAKLTCLYGAEDLEWIAGPQFNSIPAAFAPNVLPLEFTTVNLCRHGKGLSNLLLVLQRFPGIPSTQFYLVWDLLILHQ